MAKSLHHPSFKKEKKSPLSWPVRLSTAVTQHQFHSFITCVKFWPKFATFFQWYPNRQLFYNFWSLQAKKTKQGLTQWRWLLHFLEVFFFSFDWTFKIPLQKGSFETTGKVIENKDRYRTARRSCGQKVRKVVIHIWFGYYTTKHVFCLLYSRGHLQSAHIKHELWLDDHIHPPRKIVHLFSLWLQGKWA